MDYVYLGVGVVLLVALAYLYHRYTLAGRDLADAKREIADLRDDVAAANMIIAAKTDTIDKMQQAGLKEYYADAKKVQKEVDNADLDVLISDFNSKYGDKKDK